MKAKAEEMGLEFKGNISNADLQEMIDYADPAEGQVEKLDEQLKEAAKPKEEVKKVEVVPEMSIQQRKAKARKEAFKLNRCIITSMDKDKAELSGEIISAGSSFTGFVKKYIAFNIEWQVPSILLSTLKEKKLLATRTRKTPKGDVKENFEAPAYSIQELPQLTEKELEALKAEVRK